MDFIRLKDCCATLLEYVVYGRAQDAINCTDCYKITYTTFSNNVLIGRRLRFAIMLYRNLSSVEKCITHDFIYLKDFCATSLEYVA